MNLYIAEKPDLAKAVARGLGDNFTRKDGYFESDKNIVTWCFGHILEMKKPEDFNPDYKFWKLDNLPLQLHPMQLQPKESTKKQVEIVLNLIKKCNIINHLGDPDDEGQLLVDEILEYANNKKPVYRILINDVADNAVKKALASPRPNSEFKGLYNKALARQIADAIYGMSLTRACTIQANKEKKPDQEKRVFPVGRVQTPILGMITKRYLDFNSHKKSFYYVLNTEFNHKFKANYKIKDDAPVDEKGRIIEKAYLDNIQSKILNETGLISDVKKEKKETKPPLPYNLAKLQQDIINKHGYTANEIQEITQKLREKYKAITYNRSDCSYLSDDQFSDSPKIIENVKESLGLNLPFDSSIKSSAFDNSKITAHTAIIPTETKLDIDELGEKEKNVYKAICERFLIQFLPNKKYDVLTVTLSIKDETFSIRSSSTTDKGFTVLFADEDNEDSEELDSSNYDELMKLSNGDSLTCSKSNVENKETKPKPLFTEASLISALVRVADFVEDPKIKALLKLKDKDNDNEHGGIGTPATRVGIIENLKKRNYIEVKGKNVIPTSTGIDFYNAIPKQLLAPDLTALMFEQQESIERGELTIDKFVEQLYLDIELILKDIKESNLSSIKNDSDLDFNCPFCKNSLKSLPKLVKCSNNDCGLTIWLTISSKKLTGSQIKTLLTKRKTNLIKGFKSKAGKEFDAKLILNDDKKVTFEFPKNK